MSKKPSRRSFFGSALAGAATLSAASTANANPAPFRRKSPSSLEMIEIGVICTGGYNHMNTMWHVYMNPPLEDYAGGFWPRSTGMVATMCWDPNRENVEEWSKRNDVKIVDNYYDMVDKVDAVILADYESCGWFPQLTKPYLEAGIPSLINRPFALKLEDAVEMIERSKKYNTPIFVPSAFESRYEVVRQKNNLKLLLEEGALIRGALQNNASSEYAAHGCHGIYNLHEVLEPEVKAVGFQNDNVWNKYNTGMMTWRCGQEKGHDYFACVQMGAVYKTHGSQVIITDKGRLFEHYDRAGGVYEQFRWHNYPGIFNFAKMVETRKMPQTHEHILSKTKTFLTGFYSNLEKNGQMVNVADLPETWRAPGWDPDRMKSIKFD